MTTRPVVDFTRPECQPFDLPGDEHGVLLIHGFTGSAGHMRLVGERLNAQGFSVVGINLPGHAVSMDAMAETGWQDWLAAVRTAVADMKKRFRHVSVAGLSMGGVLALLAAEETELTAVATISAPMAVRSRFIGLAGVLAPLKPRLMWGASEERLQQLDQRYDCGYPGFPTRCAADLNRLINMARRDLHAVTCPLLAVQSKADEVISADSAQVILTGVSSSRKGALWLEGVPHVCTISKEYPRVAEAIGRLLREAE